MEFLILWFFTGTIAVMGDLIENYVPSGWIIAVTDNITHGLIGVFSWLSFAWHQGCLKKLTTKHYFEAILCGLLSSAVDVDHFICASSWKLSDAVRLNNRPFLHNTSLILGVSVLLLLISKIMSVPSAWVFGWMVLIGCLSHHLRDAFRRGLWLWPYDSTPPVPYLLYIVSIVVFPALASKAEIWLSKRHNSEINLLNFTIV